MHPALKGAEPHRFIFPHFGLGLKEGEFKEQKKSLQHRQN